MLHKIFCSILPPVVLSLLYYYSQFITSSEATTNIVYSDIRFLSSTPIPHWLLLLGSMSAKAPGAFTFSFSSRLSAVTLLSVQSVITMSHKQRMSTACCFSQLTPGGLTQCPVWGDNPSRFSVFVRLQAFACLRGLLWKCVWICMCVFLCECTQMFTHF